MDCSATVGMLWFGLTWGARGLALGVVGMVVFLGAALKPEVRSCVGVVWWFGVIIVGRDAVVRPFWVKGQGGEELFLSLHAPKLWRTCVWP